MHQRIEADFPFPIRGGTAELAMSAIFLRGDNGICDSLVDAVGLADVSIDGVETVQEWLGARRVAEKAGRGE